MRSRCALVRRPAMGLGPDGLRDSRVLAHFCLTEWHGSCYSTQCRKDAARNTEQGT